MTIMLIGLVIFLGAHSLRIFAEDWRNAWIERLGLGPCKAIYSVVSAIGLALAIWGFGLMRGEPVFLWQPPSFLRHVTALLMIPAFIFLVAAYVPHNHIRARLGHPMVLAVKTWALSHLLVSGRLGEIIFFTAFLAWAVLDFRAAKQRDRAHPPATETTSGAATGGTVVGGLLAAFVFAAYLHVWVVGVHAVGAG